MKQKIVTSPPCLNAKKECIKFYGKDPNEVGYPPFHSTCYCYIIIDFKKNPYYKRVLFFPKLWRQHYRILRRLYNPKVRALYVAFKFAKEIFRR